LSKWGISGECFEEVFESLCRDIVAFDFQDLDSSMFCYEVGKFLCAIVADEAIVEDYADAVSEGLELGGKGHNLNIIIYYA